MLFNNGNNINDYKEYYNIKWNVMNNNNNNIMYKNGLPENIHLLDLRDINSNAEVNIDGNDGVMLQLWNMFELNENNI